MSRLRAAPAVLLAFLGLVVTDLGREGATGAPTSQPSTGITAGGAGLGQLLVPSRAPLAAAGWMEPGSSKTRPFPYDVGRVTTAALLVVLVARLARRRPGPPWHHLRRHSAVLRAPPLLPLP
ncbi:MAG: hypothetical protein M3O23_09805 [Actinomycetota bacterium]|nr:hypothetical protein [Actinomycetota bacterium]